MNALTERPSITNLYQSYHFLAARTSRDTGTRTSERSDEAEGVHLSLRILTSHNTFLLILHIGIVNSLTPFLVLFNRPTMQQQPLPKVKHTNRVSGVSEKHVRSSNNADPLA